MHGHFPRWSARNILYSLQLHQMMELKHVRAFGTTPHPPQPHHLAKPEISVKTQNVYINT
ncbi:hypothetical protein DPMN_036407 [Dreissena polymorpha]|uniref:Uncharacterized protein n=1 Tax=Dreissena polymorpha TaxID=45954 RepID=A0A9D4M919_DREPO|nr:hypothetical protein DPMN_137133 [Dreissena polymorpha]KAH3873157.1 hypothetical protein DPMN_036384 [Dreissena polymorpha]KAH3873158.1 hypothetical protein DPMN_036385 [Dreissena polymorpha]KAH3873180.1 hypothetical protein DPMN_036407 [Dreissena polymorpha]